LLQLTVFHVMVPISSDLIECLLGELEAALADLPPVNTAAQLRVLVGRVQRAVEEGHPLAEVVDSLANATSRALDQDPWTRLDRTARLLKDALTGGAVPIDGKK
jgi:hypothetical protein